MFFENTSTRRKNRIFAVQFLYSWSARKETDIFPLDDDIEKFRQAYFEDDSAKSLKFGMELITETIQNLDTIDNFIKSSAQHWAIDRIALVDLAILRIAIDEMIFRMDIPPVVTINEAIEIGKMLSTENSGKFLNGILDNVKKQLNRPARSSGFHQD